MARTAIAWNNCIKSNNEYWSQKHNDTMMKLLDELPHGSGIDGSWWIELEDCNEERLVFGCWYHHMNENGMYDGGTDFVVTVRPSLSFGFNIKITGKFPKRYRETRDYLVEIIDAALHMELEKKEEA
jgi:hypothetical protein